MKKILTETQQKTYLEASHLCPFCKSDNISADEVEFYDAEIHQEVYCTDCEEGWVDVYNLVRVEPIAEV